MSIVSALKYFATVGRVALVLTLMVALCAAGADAARRTDADSKKSVKSIVITVSETPQVGPSPAPETSGSNMAPNSRPTTEQLAVLSAVTAPTSNDRSQDRPDYESVLLSDIPTLAGLSCGGRSPLSTLAMATPRAAQLCTLVGAVPSGTM